MILAVDTAQADETLAALHAAGEEAWVVGRIVGGEKGIDLI